jgi:hypothetical protein
MEFLPQIEEWLQQYGWKYLVSADQQGVITGFTSQSNTAFVVTIQYAEPWLRVMVPTFAELPRSERRKEMLETALKLNDQISGARFAVRENGYLSICADLFSGNELRGEDFEVALDALSHVAETYYPEFY